jgi:hypothetical protein
LLEPAEHYQLSACLFLKLLALIYFAAFFSLSGQIAGLAGSQGILPFQEVLENARNSLGISAWWKIPNLFWVNGSDPALQAAGYAGCLFATLLLLGIWPRISLVALYILYLSLFHAGQTFLTFQWDTLLLETGFLAIFLVKQPSRLVILLFYWLLFRLRFLSGISKLLSGDPAWSGLYALDFYFETQPLPHAGAWYAHQLPEGILQLGALLVLFLEIFVPFFIFLPRPFRIFAALSTIALQLLIIATSNHNFINLLTILLCLLLLDDRIIGRFLPARLKNPPATKDVTTRRPERIFLALVTLIILPTSLVTGWQMLSGSTLSRPVYETTRLIRFYGLGHTYHVFPTMQLERHELQVEGSYDGKHWQAYDFRYKPGPLDRRPAFIVPHQPRLDWMIWFVPGQHDENLYWFDRFLQRLHENSPSVTALLRENPFAEKPPRYLRAQVYRYRFTTPEERQRSGNWWKRQYYGEFPFVPPRRP